MIRPRFLFVHGWAGTPAIWDGMCADLTTRGVEAADITRVDLNPLYEGLAAGRDGAMLGLLSERLLRSPTSSPPLCLPRESGGRGAVSDPDSVPLAPGPPLSRGRQEEENSPPATITRPLIGIGHSLGVALLLTAGLPLAGLLALNGFTRFTSAPDHATGTPGRILAQMRRRLLADPQTVLADFQARAGLPHSEFSPGQAPALAAGLDILSTLDGRAAFRVFASPVMALCGSDDAIVPPDQSRADFPDPVFIDGVAHALPTRCPALVVDHLLALAARC